MTQDTIRVGVVGAGANTRDRHIPGLQAIEGVEIVSVCNRSQESGERVAERFGIGRVCTNWQDVVQAEDVDAVVIGTWPYMHRLLTVTALEADKHVMCEARMAMNASEAHCMYNALRSRPHLVAQIVPSPFSLRVDRTIQRLIRDGWLGDVLVVDIHAGGAFIDQDVEMHWRHNMDYSGLNVMTMGIWYEAMLRWVGEATSVVAKGKTFTPVRQDEQGRMMGVRIPDHIDIIADLASGGQAHIQVSNVTGFGDPPSATIYGSEGTLHFSGDVLTGGQRGDSGLSEIDVPAHEAGGWRVEEEFISAIRGHEVITHTDFATGVKYMEFTEAVHRSRRSGKTVNLPLL
ncbi:MAG: Gfo/Idh/MocA family oxidoreductase [Caldilineaceae bacterium SB0670_bin_27]|uniref:Gfo/Idh/MocA family oxidoreductase n=1 Tax=Caldilineaceae bacterium SB0664_bin_27 TaxID=2605260 RepID=A0A6B0YZC7_9CHLR|nr:Gfo/Idh/MocA family oxidoreductase [Caldilineaceae bacterium SB0664_bin_27]MYJ77838.1 Gfo/Idh/MocA family oxidoreductase [Caldilineaceae bacterium SB0670_bin_27]